MLFTPLYFILLCVEYPPSRYKTQLQRIPSGNPAQLSIKILHIFTLCPSAQEIAAEITVFSSTRWETLSTNRAATLKMTVVTPLTQKNPLGQPHGRPNTSTGPVDLQHPARECAKLLSTMFATLRTHDENWAAMPRNTPGHHLRC